MSNLNEISSCPVCGNKSFQHYMDCVDYTVSQDTFSIVECEACSFHFTNPIPIAEDIGGYYKSENYISHSSTNKGLINKLYQMVRKRTLRQKVKLVAKWSHGKSVLDIGAGTGHFLNALSDNNFDATGLEPDEDARRFAMSKFNLDIKPIEMLHSIEKETFDCVTMWHVLEHVYNLRDDIAKIKNILKPNGALIVAVPNMSSHDATHYGKYWAAYDLPIHLYHFTPTDISSLFDQFDLEVKAILPMKFDSFYVSMLSEKYKGGSLLSAFFRGLISNIKAERGTYSSQIYVLKQKTTKEKV